MSESPQFDARQFINKVLLIIFLLLLIFGSSNLRGLSSV